MSLGMMMGVSYIIGQMNAPFAQLVHFFQSAQDAKISIDRIKEIHELEPEDSTLIKEQSILNNGAIELKNVYFKYNELDASYLFENLNLEIPKGKITAIVGTSGSGKTTLLKLILKFYELKKGSIFIGNQKLNDTQSSLWRSKCGVVMQNGFLFGKTIAENIALSDEKIDFERLHYAIKIANIEQFIEELPLKLNTKIGSAGAGVSQGQQQRILIARAVYKNPQYIFLDEATSSLDANNEKVIIDNLNEFFKGKTVVVVAHRLSTVKNADKIVVLERGKIIEEGTHTDLVKAKGAYFNLVKNQLELGN
jgi:ATP-binding cassette subfamily B protein